MDKQHNTPTSPKEQADDSRENPNAGRKDPNQDLDKKGLHGKNDSGPEPEVHSREISGE